MFNGDEILPCYHKLNWHGKGFTTIKIFKHFDFGCYSTKSNKNYRKIRTVIQQYIKTTSDFNESGMIGVAITNAHIKHKHEFSFAEALIKDLDDIACLYYSDFIESSFGKEPEIYFIFLKKQAINLLRCVNVFCDPDADQLEGLKASGEEAGITWQYPDFYLAWDYQENDISNMLYISYSTVFSRDNWFRKMVNEKYQEMLKKIDKYIVTSEESCLWCYHVKDYSNTESIMNKLRR